MVFKISCSVTKPKRSYKAWPNLSSFWSCHKVSAGARKQIEINQVHLSELSNCIIYRIFSVWARAFYQWKIQCKSWECIEDARYWPQKLVSLARKLCNKQGQSPEYRLPRQPLVNTLNSRWVIMSWQSFQLSKQTELYEISTASSADRNWGYRSINKTRKVKTTLKKFATISSPDKWTCVIVGKSPLEMSNHIL